MPICAMFQKKNLLKCKKTKFKRLNYAIEYRIAVIEDYKQHSGGEQFMFLKALILASVVVLLGGCFLTGIVVVKKGIEEIFS